MTGVGTFFDKALNEIYTGNFQNNVRTGKGKIVSQIDGYSYEGDFKDGKPVVVANKILIVRNLSEEEKKAEEAFLAEVAKKNKGKKEVKKKPAEKADQAPPELQNFSTQFSSSRPFSIEFQVVFQGTPYPAPKPETKEEVEPPAKGKKESKKKNAKETDEPEMITPPPVPMIMESGRTFELRMRRKIMEQDAETGEEKEGMRVAVL